MIEVAEISNLRIDPRLSSYSTLSQKRNDTQRIIAAFQWKTSLPADFPPIYCLIGGTGTGKSTIFNSLVGKELSRVGAIRPSTRRAVVLVPELFEEQIGTCPFISRDAVEIMANDLENLGAVVLVDTPDYDSEEVSNREIADDFFIISDLIVLVTSQGKYSDLAGHVMADSALDWGKRILFLMNKVDSEEAWLHFLDVLCEKGYSGPVAKIGRITPSPKMIPQLREEDEFRELFRAEEASRIRFNELSNLRNRSAAQIRELRQAVGKEIQEISSVVAEIETYCHRAETEMLLATDNLVRSDLQGRIEDRLKTLLRKYDVFSLPRSMVRQAVKTVFQTLGEVLAQGKRILLDQPNGEQTGIAGILGETGVAPDLAPLESAVSRLNRQIAGLFEGAHRREDLKSIISRDVPRWGPDKIKELYAEAFPGIERMLEDEFEKLKAGLSPGDEFKLYGYSAATALILISVEIIVGGGFTLFDAVLDSAILPFVPKWMLDYKILNVLREIGERVDRAHKDALRGILWKQAKMYMDTLSNLTPDGSAMAELAALEDRIHGGGD